eukprot:3567646-Pyramimonas_sp.AAC.1
MRTVLKALNTPFNHYNTILNYFLTRVLSQFNSPPNFSRTPHVRVGLLMFPTLCALPCALAMTEPNIPAVKQLTKGLTAAPGPSGDAPL